MCGIAGIFDLDGQPVSPVEIAQTTDAFAEKTATARKRT